MLVGKSVRRGAQIGARGGARPARRRVSRFFTAAQPLEFRTGVAVGNTVEHFTPLLIITTP